MPDGCVFFHGVAAPTRTALAKAKAKAAGGAIDARAVFDNADVSKDGSIDIEELQGCIAKLGLPVSDDYVAEVMAQYDTDKSGTITFKEFEAYLKKQEASLKKAYNSINKDKDGRISAEEVSRR